jgi:hypothetical protein
MTARVHSRAGQKRFRISKWRGAYSASLRETIAAQQFFLIRSRDAVSPVDIRSYGAEAAKQSKLIDLYQ